MKVLYINNSGGGFADYVEIDSNTNVNAFFAKRMSDGSAEDYLIRVNRQPVPRDYVLREGDRISITPTKFEGARIG